MKNKIKTNQAFDGIILTDLLSEARKLSPKKNDLEALDCLISGCYKELKESKNNVQHERQLERKILRATDLRAVLFQKEVESMARKASIRFSIFSFGSN